jgi:hypothetical protein
MTVIRFPREETQDHAGLKTRRIGAVPLEGWAEPVFIEWELTGQSWTDRHPFTEYVYVLEGCLFVESDDSVVECGPGDLAQVTPHSTGRYWAPTYARMLSVYGPNRDGIESVFPGLEML